LVSNADALTKRDGLSKKEKQAFPMPDQDILLRNTEQHLALRGELNLQYASSLDPMSRRNLLSLLISAQPGPNTLDEQVKFIQRRMPAQPSAEKEALLSKYIRSTLGFVRGVQAQMSSPLLKELLSEISKSKEQGVESDFLKPMTSTIRQILSSAKGALENSKNDQKFVASLDAPTRIALGKSLKELHMPMMLKPIELITRLGEVLP
jgi:hypothetical protein